MKKKILIVCHDVVGKKMAGPGIRYTNIARVLRAQGHNVTLAIFTEAHNPAGEFLAIQTSGSGFQEHFDKVDFIFAQWLSTEMIDYAQSQGKILVFDLYAPVPIEYLASLEFSKSFDVAEKNAEFSVILDMYRGFLSAGQFFTCSNERQRDFWIGYATANKLITPGTFLSSGLLEKLSLCPMGIDSHTPKPKTFRLRASIPGINQTDFVLLWTGGIWDWFDAQLIVNTMARLTDKSIKLVFLGTKHPNAKVTEMQESYKARELATELRLIDKTVFFLDDWIPYEERMAYFMDADAAIYADKVSLETRFSHRTRVLDHILAELPTICTVGDYLSDLIDREGFGIVVQQRTPEALQSSIIKLSSDHALYKKITQTIHVQKSQYTWEKTLEPLIDFIAQTVVSTAAATVRSNYQAPVARPRPSMRRRAKQSIKVLLGRIDA